MAHACKGHRHSEMYAGGLPWFRVKEVAGGEEIWGQESGAFEVCFLFYELAGGVQADVGGWGCVLGVDGVGVYLETDFGGEVEEG